MKTEADHFFEKAQKWQEEFQLLREIICQNKSLEENYKWMHPCYTFGGKNIVLIHGFKDYCAILFHKGVLLNDRKGILIQQTENVQSARQIRFSNAEQIIKLKSIIINYISEAIEIETSGKKVALKKASDYPVPDEFQEVLKSDKDLKQAFYSLTQGRQKGYLFYFNQAKQSETRKNRIEKYYQRILAGKGLDD
ncbi:MAG TPA: YdeI/OmpD-associated family protein [Daejeonella sp.]|uniref:YdeI/OmpD-associated family protein n=1 Tax=Daejeonella sp. TaxID=2805397 RepID=UPI002ED98E43